MGRRETEGTGVGPPSGRVTMSAVGGTVAAGSDALTQTMIEGR